MLAVNVFVFVAAYRFSRRMTGQDWIGASLDALLIHYLVQYVSVCLPGVLGILNSGTMLLCGSACGAALWLFRSEGILPLHSRLAPLERKGTGGTPMPRFENLVVIVALLFVLGYFGSLVDLFSSAALVGDDALTYHLPSAALWIQTHRLSLYNTWFFNPANTYSPLAGSTFLVWLIAPIGADNLAQFVQMPALILVFFAIIQIGRSLGARESVAAIAAVAVLLSRPFICETFLVKDDHFVAAFFLAIVAGCSADRLNDRLGPWRIGIALGLFLATKYTALLTLALLVFVCDAPIRARWKPFRWISVLATAFVIAAPWYLRNWILTGNPLYPVPVSIGGWQIFAGMFIPERSTEMRTIAGAWNALAGGFQSPSPALVGALLTCWLIALIWARQKLLRDPVLRLCILGPIIGLAIFFLASHAALIRYAYPSLLLLFICATFPSIPVTRAKTAFAQMLGDMRIYLVLALAGLSIWGGFEYKAMLGQFVVTSAVVAAAGVLLVIVLAPWMKNLRFAAGFWSIVVLVPLAWIFVYWHAILVGSRASMIEGFREPLPDQYPMWKYIEQNVPADASIAYTNLVFTRPLMGFDYSRRVFYIPTSAGVQNYHDLANSRVRVTDQEIRAFVAKLLTASPDHDLWLSNLLRSDAQYLLVGRQSVLTDPPEKTFAETDPAHFLRIYDAASGTLYQIRR